MISMGGPRIKRYVNMPTDNFDIIGGHVAGALSHLGTFVVQVDMSSPGGRG